MTYYERRVLRMEYVVGRVERRQSRKRVLRRCMAWCWVLSVLNVGSVAGLRYVLGTP